MFAGAALGLIGGMAAGFVMSGTSGRAVIALFIAYAVFQAWRARRRG